MSKKATVREQIVRTLKSFKDIIIDDGVVDALAARCEQERLVGVKSFAYVVARNWAYDQQRRKAEAARSAAKKQIAATKARLFYEQHERACCEFDHLAATLETRRSSMPNALRYARLICLENKNDSECVVFFPNSTRDQRYQWLTRARNLLLPHASDDLKHFLLKSVGSKRKNV